MSANEFIESAKIQIKERDDIIERHEIAIVALEAHVKELKAYIRELEAATNKTAPSGERKNKRTTRHRIRAV